MVTTTTVYSFQKPAVAGDEDAWGGYLNNNIDKYESILTGNTTITNVVITTADINGGTLDNVVIGGSTAAAITGTTITGTSLVGPLATAAQTNITSLGTLTTLAVTGSATISNASGDTLTLAKDTTEPSFRIEGDANKDFVFTISGELLTLTQNDGSTDIVTFDHDTKASSFFGDISVTSGTNAKLTISDSIGEVGSGNLAFQAQNTAGSSLKPMGFRAEDIRFATGSAERVRINDTGVGIGTSSNRNSTKLDVLGDVTFGANANYYGTLAYDAGVGFLGMTSSDGEFRLFSRSGPTELMRLNASGLTVDELTINADTITATDDFIIDAASDIKLDANGGYINFFDNGTAILSFGNSSTDALIWSRASDRDMIFKGNDGGSVITALTLDMSDGGTAIFNHDVKMGDLQYLLMGDGNDLELVGDGTNGKIAAANGNLNLDVAGEIHLDADSGIIRIRDAGGDIGMLRNESNDLTVRSMVGDADLLFKGNDGGSVITALTLDMSEAGAATFNSGITTGGALELSNNDITGINDIYVASEIYHTGDTDTKIGFGTNEIEFQAGGVSTFINAQGVFIRDGSLAEDYDALSGTTPTCNVDNGGAFSLTMSGNTTFTFSGASSGYVQGFILQLTGNGSTVTYPNTVRWAGGSAPDAPASGETDILVFFSRDGGSNWYGVLSSDAAS